MLRLLCCYVRLFALECQLRMTLSYCKAFSHTYAFLFFLPHNSFCFCYRIRGIARHGGGSVGDAQGRQGDEYEPPGHGRGPPRRHGSQVIIISFRCAFSDVVLLVSEFFVVCGMVYVVANAPRRNYLILQDAILLCEARLLLNIIDF